MNKDKKIKEEFSLTYKKLPECFYTEVEEGDFPNPRLVLYNENLEREIGLKKVFSSLSEEEKALILSGNQEVDNSVNALAMAYCGHQFGYFTMLGDGRAKLIGEWENEGERFDLHLKGSGRTAYSRNGDGKSAFSPALREYLISEAMFSLGIPTTRSLAVTLTGEKIYREGYKHGAVLARVAKSHLRVGTFEFSRVTSTEAVEALSDYAIERHYPHLLVFEKEGEDNRYLKFLEEVVKNQAKLIAKWQCIGFIHGVMNTDNMSITGETIDYGPCAFMNEYNPRTVFSSIDTMGRYRYENQPEMAKWNLTRLGESLLPILADEEGLALKRMKRIVSGFEEVFQEEWLLGMRKKLGLHLGDEDFLLSKKEADRELILELLELMYQNKADFTNTFVRLTLAMGGENATYLEGVERLFLDEKFFDWTKKWKERFLQSGQSMDELFLEMKKVNPFFIPRNHIVEGALSSFEAGYTSLYTEFYEALRTPFVYNNERMKFQELDPIPNPNYRTFCGT